MESIKFRVGRTAIVPYVEVGLQRESTMAGDLTAVLKELIVGPCPEPELAVSSAMLMFDVQKMACPSFAISRTPYRQS
jgi:hypothetical protein